MSPRGGPSLSRMSMTFLSWSRVPTWSPLSRNQAYLQVWYFLLNNVYPRLEVGGEEEARQGVALVEPPVTRDGGVAVLEEGGGPI